MTTQPPQKITIKTQNSPKNTRLDTILTQKLLAIGINVSRNTVQQWIKEGRLKNPENPKNPNAKPLAPNTRGDKPQALTLTLPTPKPATLTPKKIPLKILFEDEDILILNKPAGLITHPAPSHKENTLAHAILAHCGIHAALPGNPTRPAIVHRLDKDTSGVMVAAKSQAAYLSLIRQFANHGAKPSVQKTYLAFVWNAPRPETGIIKEAIGRHKTQRHKMAVLKKTDPRARPAITRYRLLERYGKSEASLNGASLLLCQPETGRTHQIRVHLAHLRCPVFGDPLYGGLPKNAAPPLGSLARKLGRHALHAQSLNFTHPKTKQRLSFESALPPALQSLRENLAAMAGTKD